MIISHKHRYLLVELPNTGSSAIHHELCDYYDGQPILRKHAYYHDFLRIANAEEKTFFTFSCIRNPLDITVSVYYKYKINPGDIFTDPKAPVKGGRFARSLQLRRFDFVQANNADFTTYFRQYYRFPPYDNWSRLSHKEFDYVIRFENLQGDFSKVLKLLRIAQIRPLPVKNRTPERKQDFWSYYTPRIQEQAVRVYGPFMKRWGYDFPPDWAAGSVPWSSQLLFQFMGLLRKRLEWGSSYDARLFRRLFRSVV